MLYDPDGIRAVLRLICVDGVNISYCFWAWVGW